jgi:hypothetical protein
LKPTKFKIYLILFLLWLASPGGAIAGVVKRFVVIVPIYKELYSQNIGLLIRSLYAQDLTLLSIPKVDVYFVVNHTADASRDAKIENAETIQLLSDLAAGRQPTLNASHQILKDVAEKPISSRLNIHVVDLTAPGLRERNIGTVRDIGLQEVMKSVPLEERASTVIAQMDGDSRVLKDYVKKTVTAFEVEDLSFAVLNIRYGDEPQSVARVYQRKVTKDYASANYSLEHALDGDLLVGGGPNIAATAEAMIGVGGVPHVTWGESIDLEKNLIAKYPGKGRSLPIPVFANYRAREESYDGKEYLQKLNDPIEFIKLNRESDSLLRRSTAKISRDSLLKVFYEESFSNDLKNYSRSVKNLKNLIGIMIEERRTKTVIAHPTGTYPELLGNPWFTEMIDADLAKFGDDHEKIIAHLTQEFPYYLSDPPREETLKIARAQAATETLLIEPYIYAKDGKSAYLAVEKERMPKFSKAFEEYYLQDLKSRWGNLSPEDFAKLSEKDGVNALRELRTILGAADTPGLESPVKEYARKVATKYLNAISGNPPAMGQAHDLATWVNFSPAVPTEGELRQPLVFLKKASSSYDHSYSQNSSSDIKDVLANAVAPVIQGRPPTPDDRRFFNEFLERSDEGAKAYVALNIESSRIFEHPDWTEEKLKRFLSSLFEKDNSVSKDWVKSWLKIYAKNRAKFLPVIKSNPDLGRAMVNTLFTGSSRYSSDRERNFAIMVKDAGPQSIEDMVNAFLGPRAAEAKDFSGILKTFRSSLDAEDFKTLVAPVFEKHARRFNFTPEEIKSMWPILANGAPDPARFDRFFSQVSREVHGGYFRRPEKRAERIEEFIKLGPSFEEAKKFETAVNTIEFSGELRAAIYPRVDSAAEFLEFTGSAFERGNKEYLTMLDQRVAENIEFFTKFRPTEDQMVALALKMNFKGEESYQKITTELVKRARYPREFAHRIEYDACLANLRPRY